MYHIEGITHGVSKFGSKSIYLRLAVLCTYYSILLPSFIQHRNRNITMSKVNIYLDPLNQAVADQLATGPPLADLTVAQFRALFEQVQKHDPIHGVTR
jgi:hypothetical protein